MNAVAAQGFFPDPLVDVSSVSPSKSTDKWAAGVLLNDGTTVVGLPNSANNILVFDSKNGDVRRSVEVPYNIRGDSAGSWRTFLWVGGVLLKDKKTVIGFPHKANTILRFDTSAKGVTAIPVPSRVNGIQKKWLGGVLLEDGTTAVGIPHNAKDILVFDSTNDKAILVPIPKPCYEGWSGGVLLNYMDHPHVVGVPFSSDYILMYNTVTKQVSGEPVPDSYMVGDFRWSGGVLLRDKTTVVFAPFNAKHILVFEPSKQKKVTGVEVPTSIGKGNYKWIDAVLFDDGVTVAFIPYSANKILLFDSITHALVGVEVPPSIDGGDAQWHGGVLLSNGQLVGIPASSDHMLVYNPKSRTGDLCTTSEICLSTNTCMSHCCNPEEIADHGQLMQNDDEDEDLHEYLQHCTTACGGNAVNGSCFPPLTLMASANWNADNVTELNWPKQMYSNESFFLEKPPADALQKATVRKQYRYTPMKGNGGAAVEERTLRFKLLWTPTNESGNVNRLINYTRDYVGMSPPLAWLSGDEKQVQTPAQLL